MFIFIVFILGGIAGLWVERSGRTEIVKSINLWLAAIVGGMLFQASLSGALIDSVLTPADLPIVKLLSMPLAGVLILWIAVMAGYLVGRLVYLLRARTQKRPA